MKKMQEVELRVVKFELSDVIVASGTINPPQPPICYGDGGCSVHQTCGSDTSIS